MKKTYFSLLSDVVFIALCAFAVCFTLIRYFFKSVAGAAFTAAAAAVAAGAAGYFILRSKMRKSSRKNFYDSRKKALALCLALSNDDAVGKLLLHAFDDQSFSLFFYFRLSAVTCDDVAQVIKKSCPNAKIICCNDILPEARSLAGDFNIAVKDIDDVYRMLSDRDLLPDLSAYIAKKTKLFKRIKERFSRKLCPSLFFWGVALLLYSYFTFYPIYYIVAGSLITLLSAVCLFFPKGQS